MLTIENKKLYLYLPPTDMRKSIDGLCILVADVLAMSPREGHLFLFRNRQNNKLKVLYYEANCFTLWYRRLEKGRYIFPRDAVNTIEMSIEHFYWLLMSDKFSRLDTQISTPENFF